MHQATNDKQSHANLCLDDDDDVLVRYALVTAPVFFLEILVFFGLV